MVDDLDRRAHQVFVEALDLEGSAQVEFVARACGDNEKLRRAVDSLLAAVSKSTDFLESPARNGAVATSRPHPGSGCN